jgi:hypothetical protein
VSGKETLESGGANRPQLANFFGSPITPIVVPGGGGTSRPGQTPTPAGGIRVVAKDLDADAKADIVVGYGPGSGARAVAFPGITMPVDGAPPQVWYVDPFPGFLEGVYVG